MKLRSRVSVSLILAVMLSLCLIPCGAAAEPEIGDNPDTERINLRKTEEERKAEFDKALTEIPYTVPELDKLAFQDGLKRSKNNFLRLYRSQWKSLGMAGKLEKAINTAFDEDTKDLTLGTAGVQIAINRRNIVDKIQEAVAFKFAGDFDDFLRELEEKWAETLQKDVADFYRRTSVLLLASDNNPMSQAYIRQSSAAQDKGQDVMEQIKTSMQEKYPDLGVSGTKLAGGVFVAWLLRKQIEKILARQLKKTALRKLARTGLGKAAGMAVPAIGWALAAWGAWDVVSMAWDAPDDVRKMLQERNQALYSTEIPEIYWDAMEPYVMDTFVVSYGKLQKTREEANALTKDPHVAGLARKLGGDEAMEFAQRISALSGVLGKAGNEDLLQDFGEFIRDSSRKDFNKLASMLQQGNRLQVKEWFKVGGTRFFDIYDSFSSNVWENFPPNKESFDALVWMTKLPPKARRVAAQLSIDDIKWIMEELPERFVSQLFGGDEKEPEVIHAEIGRLAAIPDGDSRVPWQSPFAYWWTLYGFYVKAVITLLILLPVLRLLLSLRNRTKKEPAIPGASSVVNINIPSYPSAPLPPAMSGNGAGKKHKVKLLVSSGLAPQLNTITWDISQKILPVGDSDSRILSVELDDLSDITRWIAGNSANIEVLQPDELKAEISQLTRKEGGQ